MAARVRQQGRHLGGPHHRTCGNVVPMIRCVRTGLVALEPRSVRNKKYRRDPGRRPAIRAEDAYPVCTVGGPAGAGCSRVTVTGIATSRKQTARLTAL